MTPEQTSNLKYYGTKFLASPHKYEIYLLNGDVFVYIRTASNTYIITAFPEHKYDISKVEKATLETIANYEEWYDDYQ